MVVYTFDPNRGRYISKFKATMVYKDPVSKHVMFFTAKEAFSKLRATHGNEEVIYKSCIKGQISRCIKNSKLNSKKASN